MLNDDELLLLYDLNRSNDLDQPYDCRSEFRFHKRNLPLLAELYNEVNELIISRYLTRLVRQISVPTDKDLSKPLILRLKMKTATQVLMVSTLLNVLEFHHDEPFDI